MEISYRMPKKYYDLLMKGGKDKETGVVLHGFQSEDRLIQWLNDSHVFRGTVVNIITY